MSSPYPEPTSLVPRRPVAVTSPPIRGGDQRIGDAERSQACEDLSAHYAAGRLSDDDLDVRVSAAMAARTWADLRPLLSDLPAPASPPAQLPVEPASPAMPWAGLDVVALVALICTLGVALLGACVVVLGGEPGYIVACALTAVTAGLGGMALTQVLHRGRRSIVERAWLQALATRQQRPR